MKDGGEAAFKGAKPTAVFKKNGQHGRDIRGSETAEKLRASGVSTTEALLDACATAKGRSDLEAATGISGKLILGWTNKADLLRVKGIGTQYSDLLEAVGVDTVVELSKRQADKPSQQAGRGRRRCSSCGSFRPRPPVSGSSRPKRFRE